MITTRLPLKKSLLAFAALCAAHVPAHASRSLTLDINGDGSADTVSLESAAGRARVVLALSGIGTTSSRPLVTDLAGGDAAFLEASANGAIKVQASFYGAGSVAWDETITLAWRRGRLIVAGYTFRAHERPSGDTLADCDLNLVTGRGVDRGQPVALEAASAAFATWDKYAAVPARCFGDVYPEPFGSRP